MKFVLASHNKGKLAEMRAILSELGVEVVLPSDVGVDIEVEETGTTFAENAALKAEIEALKKAAAEANPAACNSEEMEKLKEENAQLKKTNERLNYRIMHMAMSLDELNAKVGNIVVPIKKP